MKTNAEILNNYLGLLKNLSQETKLELIEKLAQSIKTGKKEKESRFEKSFGSWNSDKNPDQIINEIKGSRTFNREIESF
ncbi:MAG: hypothetical protein K9J27_10940 [Bacteroidales bacterium]|nr:hypothetical protein [Bacteroidales bacterium]MCF8334597.1 hypothetical protein [Bacteroidales bacterium]